MSMADRYRYVQYSRSEFETKFIEMVNNLEAEQNPSLEELVSKLKNYSYIEVVRKDKYRVSRGVGPLVLSFPIICVVTPLFLVSTLSEDGLEETIDIWSEFLSGSFPEKETKLNEKYDIYSVYPYRKESRTVIENAERAKVEEYLSLIEEE